MITFLLLHNISLAMKWNRWLFHSLHVLVSLFLWVTIFGQTYQHSLTLSGTLVLYECVVSLTLHLLYPWGKCPQYKPNRRLDGQRLALESLQMLKISWHFQEPNLNYSFMYEPQPTNHTNYIITAPLLVSLILNICVIFVKDSFYNSHFKFKKKWISNMKMD